MASLFSLIDFRTNDFSQCGGSSLNGAVDTAQSHSETHSAKFASGSAGYRETPTGLNKSTIYYQFWLRISAAPTTKQDIGGVDNSSDLGIMNIRLTTSRTLEAFNVSTGASVSLGTGTAVIATGTWTLIEQKVVISAGSGIYEIRVNGVVDATYTSLTNNARGNVDNCYFGPSLGNAGIDEWYDDIRADDAGYPPIPAGLEYFNHFIARLGGEGASV